MSDKSSLPPSETEQVKLVLEKYLTNENLPILNTPFSPRLPVLSNEVEYLEELDNRPVNSHFNSEKGYKFDVDVADGDKHRTPNIRLGDADVLPDPLLQLIR